MRRLINNYGHQIYCQRNISQSQITSTQNMPQIAQFLTKEERNSILQWMDRHGPFWEDARNHSPDEWFEYNHEIVTDTAIAEVAWCRYHGIEQRLVSFAPSNWEFSPIPVLWRNTSQHNISIDNFWEINQLETTLENLIVPPNSWEELDIFSRARWQNLFFSPDAFTPLNGYPFVHGCAQRISAILKILNHLKTCFDENGKRTNEGQEIYQNFFTGKKGEGGRGALFKDSSDTEKNDFKHGLTFPHPEKPGETLFCSWHGSIQTPQYRVHFSYPIAAHETLYIVYIGPKITKY